MEHVSVMRSVGHLGKRIWEWFITPSTNLWRRLAWGLWTTPPIMLFPFLLPIFEPSSLPGILAEYWQFYLLFFGVPFALGTICWKLGGTAKTKA